jgi:predicted secreted hydrolase
MDREWSTSSLSSEQVGWDWFALQLDDGSDVMWFRLRRRDGTSDPHDAGTRVYADGRARTLAAGAVALDVTDEWTSPLDGSKYPSGWRMSIPSDSLELSIAPLVAGQELNLSVRYWEGSVTVRGTRGGRPVSGRGYVELTGYARGTGAGTTTSPR